MKIARDVQPLQYLVPASSVLKGLNGRQALLRGARSRSRTEPKYIGDVSS